MHALICGGQHRILKGATTTLRRLAAAKTRDPIFWLIVSGCLLVAGIGVGTVMMIGDFRERALANSERELENTVMLLTRHFDQQFDDYQILASDMLTRLDLS